MGTLLDTVIVAVATLMSALLGAYVGGRMAASAAFTATNKQLEHSDQIRHEELMRDRYEKICLLYIQIEESLDLARDDLYGVLQYPGRLQQFLATGLVRRCPIGETTLYVGLYAPTLMEGHRILQQRITDWFNQWSRICYGNSMGNTTVLDKEYQRLEEITGSVRGLSRALLNKTFEMVGGLQVKPIPSSTIELPQSNRH